MFSLSKIKNIKNILIILLLLPTTYSIHGCFVPEIVPQASGILLSGATLAGMIAKLGLEGMRNSPQLALGLTTLSFGTGFGLYKALNRLTPESTLQNVKSVVQEHQELMNTGLWKKLLKPKSDSESIDAKTKDLNAILLKKYPGAYSDVIFSEKDLIPELEKLKKAKRSIKQATSFIDNPDKLSPLKQLDNKNTLEQLTAQKKLIETHLKTLNEIAQQVHGSDKFQNNSDNFFKTQHKQVDTIKAKERIKDLQSKNSYFNSLFEALLSSPIILNSILQIILRFMTPITG